MALPAPPAQRERLYGVVAPLSLGAAIMVADLVEGPRTQYVGTLVGAPFLAASFVGARTTVAVGALVTLMGAAYGAYEGVATSMAQLVRLALIVGATAIAAVAAAARERRERQLVAVATVAEAVQRTVLRPLPEVVGHARVAVRYLAAVAEARVGGDLYEAVESPRGTRFLVGDVRGKGLQSVRLAAAVAAGFRTLAGRDVALEELASDLDRVVDTSHTDDHADEEFVTALVVELVGSRARVISCGHPPPLLVSAAGQVTTLELQPSPPLGMSARPLAAEVDLPAGSRMLLHTDGATDVRQDGRWFDLPAAAAELVHGPVDAALERLKEQLCAFGGGRLPDDVALLLLEPVSPVTNEARVDASTAVGAGSGGA